MRCRIEIDRRDYQRRIVGAVEPNRTVRVRGGAAADLVDALTSRKPDVAFVLGVFDTAHLRGRGLAILPLPGGRLAVAGVACGWTWWQRQQKREGYLEMLRQAQVYAALQGQRPPGAARRPVYPAMQALPGYPTQAAPPSVIVVGQQPQTPYPPPYAYSSHYPPVAMGQGEGDPYAGFLLPPPDDDEWEVLD